MAHATSAISPYIPLAHTVYFSGAHGAMELSQWWWWSWSCSAAARTNNNDSEPSCDISRLIMTVDFTDYFWVSIEVRRWRCCPSLAPCTCFRHTTCPIRQSFLFLLSTRVTFTNTIWRHQFMCRLLDRLVLMYVRVVRDSQFSPFNSNPKAFLHSYSQLETLLITIFTFSAFSSFFIYQILCNWIFHFFSYNTTSDQVVSTNPIR